MLVWVLVLLNDSGSIKRINLFCLILSELTETIFQKTVYKYDNFHPNTIIVAVHFPVAIVKEDYAF